MKAIKTCSILFISLFLLTTFTPAAQAKKSVTPYNAMHGELKPLRIQENKRVTRSRNMLYREMKDRNIAKSTEISEQKKRAKTRAEKKALDAEMKAFKEKNKQDTRTQIAQDKAQIISEWETQRRLIYKKYDFPYKPMKIK